MKYKIIKLICTTGACPTQWDGRTDDDRPVYIRYRGGRFQAYVGNPGEDDMKVFDHRPILVRQLTNDLDGVMGFKTMVELTKDIFEFEIDGDGQLNPYDGEKPFENGLMVGHTEQYIDNIKKQLKGGNK